MKSHRSHPEARRTLYRSREGWIFGVCRGLADYADLPVAWVRIAFLIAMPATAILPVIVFYIVAALLMKPEPMLEIQSDDDLEFYESFSGSRPLALARLKRHFDALDRRIQRMEDRITNREFDWDHRLRTGR